MIGRQINAKLLEIERVADGAVPGPSFFERLQLPTRLPSGQRVSALHFGEPRVHALFGALCRFSHLPHGFRHRDLRPLEAALLGRELAANGNRAQSFSDVLKLARRRRPLCLGAVASAGLSSRLHSTACEGRSPGAIVAPVLPPSG
jgi:hypothetical protein